MSTGLQKQLNSAMLGGLFASLICANGIVGAAPEVEPNDAQAQAQTLVITDTGASVSATMGTASGVDTTELDIYAFDVFEVKDENGNVILDVPAIMVVSDGSWDSMVVLYDADGSILDMNDDAETMNPGSVVTFDSRIDWHPLTPGRYYIAVTPMSRILDFGFQVVSMFDSPNPGGPYTLVVQGVTPPPPPPAPEPEPSPTPDPVPEPTPDPTPTPEPTPVPTPSSGDPMPVKILVKHWHGDEPSLGRYKGKYPIPVAILSAPGFKATKMIDEKSLRFGATGTERSLIRCDRKGKDVRVDKVKDGKKDLICYFRPDVAGFKAGDVQAFLTGDLVGGGEIKGTAVLRTFEMSKKKDKGWHKRHNVDPRAKKYRSRNHRDHHGDNHRGNNRGKRGDD